MDGYALDPYTVPLLTLPRTLSFIPQSKYFYANSDPGAHSESSFKSVSM